MFESKKSLRKKLERLHEATMKIKEERDDYMNDVFASSKRVSELEKENKDLRALIASMKDESEDY